MNAILNPVVPFDIPIAGGVQPGKIIRIQGFIPYVSNRFSVKLLCAPNGDVALHLCPKFDQKCVVRSCVQNMRVGCEESCGGMPVQPGQNFELLILCDPQNFKIAFNGQHFAEFTHRIPYNAVTSLVVEGQVTVHSVSFDHNTPVNANIGLAVPPNIGFVAGPGQPNPGVPPPYSAAPYPANYGAGNYGGNAPNYGGRSPNYGRSSPNYGGTPYPPNPPANSPYPVQPQGYGSNVAPYPQAPGGYPVNGNYSYPTLPQQPHSPKPHKSAGLLDKAGMAVAGVLGASTLMGGHKNKLNALGEKLGAAVASATALTDHLNPKKAIKKQMKAHKKAMKYGLPIAGAGLGAYALHKGFRGFRRSSSSSSSSSD